MITGSIHSFFNSLFVDGQFYFRFHEIGELYGSCRQLGLKIIFLLKK